MESEEKNMADYKWDQVANAIKEAKKNSAKLSWNEDYRNFIEQVEAFAPLFNRGIFGSTNIPKKDSDNLFDKLLTLVNSYNSVIMNAPKEVKLQSEDYQLFQKSLNEASQQIDKILSDQSNKKLDDVIEHYGKQAVLLKNSMNKFSEYLDETAKTNEVFRYSDEVSDTITRMSNDELQGMNKDEQSLQLLNNLNLTLSRINNSPDVNLDTKLAVSQKYCDIVRLYDKYYLFTKEQREKVVLDQAHDNSIKVLSDFSTANANVLGDFSMSKKDHSALETELMQLQKDITADFTHISNVSEKNKEEITAKGKDLFADESKKQAMAEMQKKAAEDLKNLESEQKKNEAAPKNEKPLTTAQINLTQMRKEMPEQYDKIPFISQVHDMLGVSEEDLDAAGYDVDIKYADPKTLEDKTVNLKKAYMQMQHDIMNVVQETASRFREYDTGKASFMNSKELAEVNEKYKKFTDTFMELYDAGVENNLVAPGENLIKADDPIYNKALYVFDPVSHITDSTKQATDYIKKYAIRGVQSNKKLFSMYEMMGKMNPDADNNFLTDVKNMNAAIGTYLNSEEIKNKKVNGKFQEGFLNNLSDGQKEIKNLADSLPTYFKDNSKVFSKKNQENVQILPFIKQDKINELFNKYLNTYLALKPFIEDCEKKLEGHKDHFWSQQKKFTNEQEFDLYSKALPIYDKVQKKLRLLGYLENTLQGKAQDDELGQDIENYNKLLEKNKDNPKLSEIVYKNYTKEQVEFFKYAVACQDMLRTGQLLPQFLLEDNQNPRVSDILSMHKKKKDIDYAIKFEEKLTNKEWKDGKRDFSDITDDFKKHRLQLGTDDKLVQFATPNSPEQFKRILNDTINGFFPKVGEKKSYSGVAELIDKNTGKTVGFTNECISKYGLKNFNTEAGQVINISDRLLQLAFDNTDNEKFMCEDFSVLFSKDELKDQKVKETVKKLNETFKMEPSYSVKGEDYGKSIIGGKEVDNEELRKKLANKFNDFLQPDENGKTKIEEYANGGKIEGLFTKEELHNEDISNFNKALKRNLYNAGLGKTAKLNADVPEGYCEGDAKQTVNALIPGLYPKVTMYDDMTLPFHMGQAQYDQVSHVRVGRVQNNFSRNLIYKTDEKTKKISNSQTAYSTVRDFRKCPFIGDTPSVAPELNPGDFKGKDQHQIDQMLEKAKEKAMKGASPRTNELRNYRFFNTAKIKKAAADLQMMDYLLGIPPRDVEDIRLNLETKGNTKDTLYPYLDSISAADNGKLPFSAKNENELADPKQMRVITPEMKANIERWSQGKFDNMEKEQFKKLPPECAAKFTERAKTIQNMILLSNDVEWKDQVDKDGKLIQFGKLETRPSFLRTIGDDQWNDIGMDDLAVGRNEAKNAAEKNNAKPKNIFDTIAKMPSACNDALVDKAIVYLDPNASEEYGKYNNYFGEGKDNITRDKLNKRFNRFETERLLESTRALSADFYVMDKNRKNEYLWHKWTGSSDEYRDVRDSVYALCQQIADEHNLTKKEIQAEKGDFTGIDAKTLNEIKDRKAERERLRKELADQKGNKIPQGTIKAEEDPLLYHRVHKKMIDTCKLIENYLEKKEGPSKEFGKERIRGLVSIYNKLNKQLDEYAQLSGDTSYVPKRIELDEKKYTVKYSNLYDNRHEFEMSLPDTVNREYKERMKGLAEKEKTFDDPTQTPKVVKRATKEQMMDPNWKPDPNAEIYVDPNGLKQKLKQERMEYKAKVEEEVNKHNAVIDSDPEAAKSIGMKKKEAPNINVDLYDDFVNVTHEEVRPQTYKYKDPNTKEGRNAPAPRMQKVGDAKAEADKIKRSAEERANKNKILAEQDKSKKKSANTKKKSSDTNKKTTTTAKKLKGPM